MAADTPEETRHFDTELPAPSLDDNGELKGCCKKTIDLLGENNPMMVCGDCKQIIKCFDNEKAYRNYQLFCRSRHRSFLATFFEPWWVVVFRSYDTYPV